MQFNCLASTLSLALVLRLTICSASRYRPCNDYYHRDFAYHHVREHDRRDDYEVTTIPQEATLPYLTRPTSKPCNCSCGLANHKSRIVGGHRVQPHEFPWLAAMSREGRLYCAASLITAEHLLTAAHCLRGFDKDDITVTLGGHNRNDFKTPSKNNALVVRKLEKVALHPNFNPMTYDNDLAVMTMDKPVIFTRKINPVCLPIRENGNYTGSEAVVVGWGRTAETKPTSSWPLKVEVVVLSKENCDKSGYGPKRITDNMFCAGYLEGGKDSCQGDSGGPLHVFNRGASTEMIGVVSWGRGCARSKFPGVYTKISNYMDFIQKNIEPVCLCSPL